MCMCMKYAFCPFCGTEYADNSGHSYRCTSCHKSIYLNSSPTASTLITDGDRILLGRRGVEPSKDMWDIIGGFLDYGEHPHDGAIREAKEESGLDVEITGYLGTFMDSYGDDGVATLNMGFVSTVTGGEMKADDDIVELRWFSVNDLPKDIAFENGQRMIDAWKKSLTS